MDLDGLFVRSNIAGRTPQKITLARQGASWLLKPGWPFDPNATPYKTGKAPGKLCILGKTLRNDFENISLKVRPTCILAVVANRDE